MHEYNLERPRAEEKANKQQLQDLSNKMMQAEESAESVAQRSREEQKQAGKQRDPYANGGGRERDRAARRGSHCHGIAITASTDASKSRTSKPIMVSIRGSVLRIYLQTYRRTGQGAATHRPIYVCQRQRTRPTACACWISQIY